MKKYILLFTAIVLIMTAIFYKKHNITEENMTINNKIYTTKVTKNTNNISVTNKNDKFYQDFMTAMEVNKKTSSEKNSIERYRKIAKLDTSGDTSQIVEEYVEISQKYSELDNKLENNISEYNEKVKNNINTSDDKFKLENVTKEIEEINTQYLQISKKLYANLSIIIAKKYEKN